MKILIVSNLYPPEVLGGYEILCRQVATRLQAMGHQVDVLTSEQSTIGRCEDYQDGIRVRRWLKLVTPFDQPGSVARRLRKRIGDHNAAVTRELLGAGDFDVVYVWSQLRLTLGAARAAQAVGCPTVFNLNDEHLAGYLPAEAGWTLKRALRYATDRCLFADTTLLDLDLTHATCISRCLKQRLLTQGVDVRQAEVIYQGIPIEKFPLKQHSGRVQRPARLLFVGQLHAYKGPHTLLRSVEHVAAEVGAENVCVTIAGAGQETYVRELQELAANMAVKVSFPGWVDRDELPALLRKHDLFVFPSEWHEPFGLTQLEAMASGLPVVSTAVGGHGECLDDEQNALVFQPGDDRQLADCLVRLIRDPQLAARLAYNAREMVEQHFTIDRYATDLEAFLLRRIACPSLAPTTR